MHKRVDVIGPRLLQVVDDVFSHLYFVSLLVKLEGELLCVADKPPEIGSVFLLSLIEFFIVQLDLLEPNLSVVKLLQSLAQEVSLVLHLPFFVLTQYYDKRKKSYAYPDTVEIKSIDLFEFLLPRLESHIVLNKLVETSEEILLILLAAALCGAPRALQTVVR